MSLDLFDTTNNSYKNQVFYQSGTWVKPRGITMVSFFVVGAGGGGGTGSNTTPGATGNGGGGGGGGGAVSRLIIPAIFLPDNLTIVIGVGGDSATNGGNTYVDLPNGSNVFTTRLVFSNGGGAGGNASASTNGTAGTGGAAASVSTSAIYLNLGIQSSLAGGNGGGPSATTTTNLTSGGGRGGQRNSLGTRSNPGGVIGNNTTLASVEPGDFNTSFIGSSGINVMIPFQSYGGAGGWSSVSTANQCGGDGGTGILGSGGGGGGGGNTGCPTGVSLGGKGGDGFVIINCF